MEHLERVAYQVVGRAIGFAGLAIFCLLIGLSWDPVLAARTGGILSTVTSLVLIGKAAYVPRQNHKRTEMWLYLPKDARPPEAYAHWAVTTVMREAYLRFAQFAATIAVIFLVAALILPLLIQAAEATGSVSSV